MIPTTSVIAVIIIIILPTIVVVQCGMFGDGKIMLDAVTEEC